MNREAKLYKAINTSNGIMLADKLKIAHTFKSRSIGLLNRVSLGTGEALWIEPCSSIHTFFMKFSIDVLFLDKDMRVVKVVKNIQPWRLAGCFFGAYRVIEFLSGAIKENTISQGNIIKIEEIS